ncbi:CoA-binding protein [Aromatoleum petrolei]|uniref:CoA-binding protein n=1 Tax=Aromatoleum petrolei TaxID=76116 RepID=A0ABX1MKH4_9RHOO|nr:CoA-binding protein [Aromatoleum petrolei]NMF88233.1 CoA-binding protein [Aromatoleum petrolei]QTQ38066.1 Acyl-CoA synthetase [Aromatoleum petrolei]
MNDRTTISPGEALNAATGELFRQAGSEGRDVLNADELQRFVASFGAALTEGAPGGVDLRITLENTREFGIVLTAGAGGLDGALDRANFRKDRASVSASVELTDAADFLRLFRRTVAYQKMAAIAQRDGRRAPDPVLEFCFGMMLGLGREYSARNPQAGFVIRRIELDQVQFAKKPTVGAARVEFGKPVAGRLPRPVHKIDKLIHPQSIGIVGVSASGMNFGRIILKNLMGSGYPKDKLTIIRPGETEIDGVRCVESLRALPAKLDLLIVAVPNDAVYALVDEIIDTDAVESVMLIPGGLGETAKSREPAAELAAKINAAHGKPGGGPIFLGANCLGVVSHPGGYDSWFIPLERLPKPQKKAQRNSVMLSQSGAFMITRISQNPWLDPAYMLALGNQTDLTHGDMLDFFAEREGIDTLGIYIEGFKDGDGLDFAHAVRKAVLKGKQVVVYKSGRTEAGAGGVMGHTASIAGDPALFDAVLRQAGAIVAEDFNTFDDLFYVAGALHGKKVGTRLGAISGAGFEAVGMADSIATETSSLEMGMLEATTVERVQAILTAKRLDALVEVRNPIDINPGADDEAHLQITEAFLDDPNIDAVVVGLDPTAPSIRGLETSKLRPGYDLSDPKGTVHIYPPLAAKSEKPVIGIVDGGSLYDAMAAKLMDQGVCVFRNCGRGTRALARYVEARVEADMIRERNK